MKYTRYLKNKRHISKKLTYIGPIALFLAVPVVWFSHVFAACSFTVTNTNDSGAGSFRQAILSANGNGSSQDTICFNISGGAYQTISVNSMLTISQPAIVDGTSQPGYSGQPVIEINGANAGSGASGINVTGGNTTIKGLIVNRFAGDGIILNNNGGDTVVNNYVGTNSAGTAALGNGASGIGVATPNNTVGGTTAADRNVVSGNAGTGVAITGAGASGNTVEGNYLGTDYTGTADIGNGADGLLITNAPNNTVGGTTGVTPGGDCTGACNLSSGNGANGFGIWQSSATGNVVKGNYAGVNVHGTSALGNSDIGFEAQDAPNNTIGGTTAAERNVFSGNGGAGVSLTGTSSTGNIVEGNYIGVDVSGQSGIGNHKMGVNIGSPSGGSNNASSNTIGGTAGTTPGGSCTGACNVIAGNAWNGIYISGSTGGNNSIAGNFIGMGASGGVSIGNVLDGVGIVGSPNNKFGGPSADARNLVAANGGNGFAIVGSTATGTRIEGNYIGEATNAGCMPNRGDGVEDSSAVYTAIIGNNIFCSGYLGIDLNNDGPTKNHAGGATSGANENQNYPTLAGVYPSGSNTQAVGSLSSDPNTSFRIDIFSGPYCDRTGYGQGQQFLGSATVTTNGAGNVSFNIPVAATGEGAAITSTATKFIGGTTWETSEFSGCVYSPRHHPDGSIIRPVGSSNLFKIVDGKVSPIGSVGVLRSYNIASSQIKDATTADTNLPGTTGVYFREGTLLKGSSPNVYVIDEVSPGSYVKRLITSGAFFNALGYNIGDVITVPDSDLSVTSGSDINDASQHPDGAFVKDPNSSSVYQIVGGNLCPIGTPAVLTTQQLYYGQIKYATSGDLGLTGGNGITYREGSVLKGSGSAIYVMDNNSGTEQKRQIGSGAALTELEFYNSDIIPASDAELASLPNGSPI